MEQSSRRFLDKLKAKLDRNGTIRNGKNALHSSVLKPTRTVVSVNVYDMLWLNVYTNSLGIGVYHTGVVIYGTEYCYGGHPFEYSGIFAMVPQDTETLGPNYSYKTTINLGWTDFTESEVSLILEDMGPQYRGDQYHLLHRNCNHFSDAFVQILCGASLPKWINRLASVGAKLPFVERSIPKVWLTPRPLEDLSSSRSDQADVNTDTVSLSCPVILRDNLPSDSISTSKRRPSALFSRVHFTVSRRSNQLDRPSSSASFRNLIRRPRDRPMSITNSLANLADSLDTETTLHPITPTRSTADGQSSTHLRPYGGDSRRLNPVTVRSPLTLEELDCGECENDDSTATVSLNPRRHSLLASPVSSMLTVRRPSLVHAPSSCSVQTNGSIKSLDHRCNVPVDSSLSPQRPKASLHSSCDLHKNLESTTIQDVLDQQPVAIQLHSLASHKSEDAMPTSSPPRRDNQHRQPSTNYAQTIASGLLSRLQNLCGTAEHRLPDPNRPNSSLDGDTNNLANGAF